MQCYVIKRHLVGLNLELTSRIGQWDLILVKHLVLAGAFFELTLKLLLSQSKSKPIPCIRHSYVIKRHLVGSNLGLGSTKCQWELILVKHGVLVGALFELGLETLTFTL